MRLWAHQRAFRSPFGNLRMSPLLAAGDARRVALGYRKVVRRGGALRWGKVCIPLRAAPTTYKPVHLRATLRAPPPLLTSGDRGKERLSDLDCYMKVVHVWRSKLNTSMVAHFAYRQRAKRGCGGCRLMAYRLVDQCYRAQSLCKAIPAHIARQRWATFLYA